MSSWRFCCRERGSGRCEFFLLIFLHLLLISQTSGSGTFQVLLTSFFQEQKGSEGGKDDLKSSPTSTKSICCFFDQNLTNFTEKSQARERNTDYRLQDIKSGNISSKATGTTRPERNTEQLEHGLKRTEGLTECVSENCDNVGFRICLMHHTGSVDRVTAEADSEQVERCTFGEKTVWARDLLPGVDGEEVGSKEGVIQRNVVSIPFNFTWPGSFSLYIEVFKSDPASGVTTSRDRLLLVVASDTLGVQEGWVHREASASLNFPSSSSPPREYSPENLEGPLALGFENDSGEDFSRNDTSEDLQDNLRIKELDLRGLDSPGAKQQGAIDKGTDISGTSKGSNTGTDYLGQQSEHLQGGIGEIYPGESGRGGIRVLRYSYRVVCSEHYYGSGCTDVCRSRDDILGHYECSLNGTMICKTGWSGPYCRIAVCSEGCSKEHGFCYEPNQCKCKLGWQGPQCNECIPYPGCQHGTCEQPYECNCEHRWGGSFCNQDLNFCTTHQPCRNNGTCLNSQRGSYQCRCLPGFSGTNCEMSLTDCRLQHMACLNDAVCLKVDQLYECRCPLGFQGRRCEQRVAESCGTSPCLNGATCHPGHLKGPGRVEPPAGYRCSCAVGYTGVNCDVEIDECLSQPCLNDGSCVDERGGYSCVCPVGYTGARCDSNIDDCAPNPCLNGATCVDLVNGFDCYCPLGLAGRLCERDVDECATVPCANGATCLDQLAGFNCLCAPGFTGPRCELTLDECTSNPCLGNSTCLDRLADYECICDEGFMGKNCQYPRGFRPQYRGESSTDTPGEEIEDGSNSGIIGEIKNGTGMLESREEIQNEALTLNHIMLIAGLAFVLPLTVLTVTVIAVVVLCNIRKRRQKSGSRNVNQLIDSADGAILEAGPARSRDNTDVLLVQENVYNEVKAADLKFKTDLEDYRLFTTGQGLLDNTKLYQYDDLSRSKTTGSAFHTEMEFFPQNILRKNSENCTKQELELFVHNDMYINKNNYDKGNNEPENFNNCVNRTGVDDSNCNKRVNKNDFEIPNSNKRVNKTGLDVSRYKSSVYSDPEASSTGSLPKDAMFNSDDSGICKETLANDEVQLEPLYYFDRQHNYKTMNPQLKETIEPTNRNVQQQQKPQRQQHTKTLPTNVLNNEKPIVLTFRNKNNNIEREKQRKRQQQQQQQQQQHQQQSCVQKQKQPLLLEQPKIEFESQRSTNKQLDRKLSKNHHQEKTERQNLF